MADSLLLTKPAPAAKPAAPAEKRASLGQYYPHRRWVLMLSLMVALSLGLSVLFCGGCAFWSEDFLVTFGYNFFYTTGLWLANGFPSEWLNRRVDWTAQPIRRFLITLGLSLVMSLLVILLVTGSFLVFYHHRPLSSLTWRPFVMPLLITVVISLFMHSRSFLLGWRDAAIQAERLQKENAQAQADSLRRQLDPHFLFNSLNALTSLVEEHDPARATRFIRQLSQVYRYVLDSQAQEVVSVAEEMRFVESYVFLQRTRLGEGLHVEMQLPPAAALETLWVPPLAVQLLLENALKHNATSQRDPLRIAIELDPAARQLTVRNALRPRRLAEGESTGLGLENLRARYAFLTKEPVAVTKTETEFIVTLPLLKLE
ncbi:sensor histidine kinase [Hymenobacter psychrotolerans]|uniref:Histidine kinase n=1 Tax=Hymenobacter psychrotolerans DSM 18569 TaxID=1121959 RepID=A0A1M6Y140_9BACT|nr:histidine kinase [Hymenobacter psychrotolerans]SHL11940.1 Histidine kinase [Hymenobacter psychrotolerans DSM 18569]